MKHITRFRFTQFNIENFEAKLKTSKLALVAIATAKENFRANIAVYGLDFYG